jgi:hypothetical protein
VTVALILATTPEARAFAFIPVTMQVAVPEPDAQERVFAAAVVAGPAAIERAEIWLVE